MASEVWKSATIVDDPLQKDGKNYAFFQAIRLLSLRFPPEKTFTDGVRIRPHLGLAFPSGDLNEITLNDDEQYHLEANFFGLYGVTSPLPTFYTEDLLDEQRQGNSAGRDFLDILHASLYPLLYSAWKKHRIWLSIIEQQDPKNLNLLEALLGLSDAESEQRLASQKLLRFAGLFNQFPRSALGLEQLARIVLDNPRINVISCLETSISIDHSARCFLGNNGAMLGDNSLLGYQVQDRSLTLDIRITPRDKANFLLLLPGNSEYLLLACVVFQYLQSPLNCRLTLSLEASQQHGVMLGQDWHELGLNTWLGTSTQQDSVMFTLHDHRIAARNKRNIQ